ncbi:hypothetical protein cyc_07006 [Cyclospora cayetanensis]|uniref:BEACH domain-containing protein n=1 Tax=Cyclospora cayetanensis TaxID=88456 RepID=A0A1D3CY40_9EIME|nr:hypothetical protein cyc_07006 [Cyclospora cayetanensis]
MRPLLADGEAPDEDKQLQQPPQLQQLVTPEMFAISVQRELQQHVRFSFSQLDHREQLLLPTNTGFWVSRIRPLMSQRALMLLTPSFLYLEPHPNFTNKPAKRYPLYQQDGLGVRHQKNYKVLLLEFADLTERERVACALEQLKPQAFMLQASDELLRCMQQRWLEGRLSSLHYLQFLNSAAGRSTSNFSAYPVFPWVIQRYSEADAANPLSDPAAYRDLSKPIGALNPQRLEGLLKRMKDIQVDAGGVGCSPSAAGSPSSGDSGASGSNAAAADLNYIYGSHYSTPAYTVHFLVRLLPECLLRLHCGRFDCPHRIFRSMQGAWAGAYSGQSTFVELTPEFYSYDPSFLCNRLAIRLSAKPTDAVAAAATGSCCPTGNQGDVFSLGLSRLLKQLSPLVRNVQLQEFGQTPIKLFSQPHPMRLSSPPFDPVEWEFAFGRSAPRHLLTADRFCISATAAPNGIEAEGAPCVAAPTEARKRGPTSAPITAPRGICSSPAAATASPSCCDKECCCRFSNANVGPLSPQCCDCQFSLAPVFCLVLQQPCQQQRGSLAVIGRDGRLCCFDALEGGLFQQEQALHSLESVEAATPSEGLSLSAYASAIHRKVTELPLTSVAHLGSWRLLALGCTDGSIYLQTLPHREVMPSRTSLSSGADDSAGCSSFYELPSGGRKEKQRAIGHIDSVLSLFFEKTDGILVSGAADATVRVWGVSPAALLLQRLFDEPFSEVTATAASGPLVLAGTASGQVLLWDLRCASPCVWEAPQGGPNELAGPVKDCSFAEGGRVAALVHAPRAAAALHFQEERQLQQLWELRGGSRVPFRGQPGAWIHPGATAGVVTCGILDDTGLALLAGVESASASDAADCGGDGGAVVRLVDCIKREEISRARLRTVRAPRYISAWPANAPALGEASAEGKTPGAWGPTLVAVGEAGGAVEVLWV